MILIIPLIIIISDTPAPYLSGFIFFLSSISLGLSVYINTIVHQI
jgi:hypothetical protein